jgi:hypothetical protein
MEKVWKKTMTTAKMQIQNSLPVELIESVALLVPLFGPQIQSTQFSPNRSENAASSPTSNNGGSFGDLWPSVEVSSDEDSDFISDEEEVEEERSSSGASTVLAEMLSVLRLSLPFCNHFLRQLATSSLLHSSLQLFSGRRIIAIIDRVQALELAIRVYLSIPFSHIHYLLFKSSILIFYKFRTLKILIQSKITI